MMSRPIALLAGALASVVLATAGCASGGGAAPEAGAASPEAGAAPSSAQRRAGNRNVLSPEELASSGSSNLLDVVSALRPRWLQNTSSGSIPTRGAGGFQNAQGVAVYVNGQLFGDVRSLETIQKSTVADVRYLSVTEAQQRYGTRVYAPVIEVRLKSGGE